MNSFNKLIATFFFTGLFPFAPGTIGSLAGLIVFAFLILLWTPLAFIFIAGLCLMGTYCADSHIKQTGKEDPPEVVIDEVLGQAITLLFIPLSLKTLILGFVLFRFFDIVKIPPVSTLEKLPGTLGVMADDIAAGLFANILLQLIIL